MSYLKQHELKKKKTMKIAELAGLPASHMQRENSNLPETWQKFQLTLKLVFQGLLRNKEQSI